MGQPRIVSGGCRGEILRLDQRHGKASPRRIACGEATGGPAADDQAIECFRGKSGEGALHGRAKLSADGADFYLILPSLKVTCLRSTGSYFLIENFSVMVRVFFLVT